MKKIKNLFLYAEKMKNVFVSSNGFYSMQCPQGTLMFDPNDKLLTEKADAVKTWPPHFYGISKNNFSSLYKTSGKCILKDVANIAVSQDCATYHNNENREDYHVIIWKKGWYSLKCLDRLTIFNEKDEVLFENLFNAKEFNNGYYAVQDAEGWTLYTESGEILLEKALLIDVLFNGFYAAKYGKLWSLYNAEKQCLTTAAEYFLVRENLYALMQHGVWNLYRANGQLLKENLINVNLWDNGYYAYPENGLWKLFNQDDRLLACNALGYQVYRHGFFGARQKNGNIYFCSPDGSVISTKTLFISDLYDNLFWTKGAKNHALYNTEGKLLAVSPSYIKAGNKGHYAVKKDNLWNVYDSQGNPVACSVLDVVFYENGGYSLQKSENEAEMITPKRKIKTFTKMRMERCDDGYYIGYYASFMQALYSPWGELLYKDLSSAYSLGNQQFLLQDSWSNFVFFVDFSKDCLTYFQHLLKELAEKKFPLSEIQKEYARYYVSFLKRE